MQLLSALPDLTQALDRFLTDHLHKDGLYGAAVVMVAHGEVVCARAYGHADPMTGRPFDAAETVLPVASIAKALTATAVMQLVDRGLIRMDADVNQYLPPDQQLAATFAEPVTIAHLLTHTEGFQERNIGIVATDAAALVGLGPFFRRQMPGRVYPPGQRITYGNWASGLLGLVVEQVSGQSFSEYAASQLFAPLGMTSTTFAQPAPAELVGRCLRECVPGRNGTFAEAAHVYAQMAPAGGLLTSLPDMGRYLQAMLGDGGGIMRPAAIRAMHERRFAHHPALPGITYGFFEEFRHGRRVLRRDGDSAAAWSRIYLLPEEGIGLFYTVAGNEEARLALADAFFDSLGGQETARAGERLAPAGRFDGIYRYAQHNRETFTKLQSLFVGQVRVKSQSDGTLTVTALTAGDVYGGFSGTTQWAPTGVDTFERIGGHGQIAFRGEGSGQPAQLFSSMRYQGSFERLRWFETAPFHFACLSVALLAFLVGSITFGILPLTGALAGGLTVGLMGLHSVLSLLFCVLLIPAVFLIGNVGGGFPAYGFGINGWVRGILTLPLLTTALTAGLLYGSWAVVESGVLTPLVTGLYWLVTAVSLGFIWWLRFWNLLGYRW